MKNSFSVTIYGFLFRLVVINSNYYERKYLCI